MLTAREIVSKPIETGNRMIYCDNNNANHNHSPLYNLFQAVFLTNFLSLNLPVFPDRVREFYSNFRFINNSSTRKPIRFTIDGDDFRWDHERFNEALGLPNYAYSWYTNAVRFDDPSVVRQYPDQYDYLNEVMETVVHDGHLEWCQENMYVLVNQIKHNLRPIHRIIHNSISCRGQIGIHDVVPVIDVFMIHWVVNGIFFDPGNIMLNRMKESVTTHGAPLPYGMVLTKFFRFLDLEDEDNGPSFQVPTMDVINCFNRM